MVTAFIIVFVAFMTISISAFIIHHQCFHRNLYLCQSSSANHHHHEFSLLAQVSFNPQDNTQLCVIGNTIFRHFRYSEGNLKPFNFQKMEPQNYMCHAWVSEERIVVGTDNGRLLLFEAGELKNEINLAKDDK